MMGRLAIFANTVVNDADRLSRRRAPRSPRFRTTVVLFAIALLAGSTLRASAADLSLPTGVPAPKGVVTTISINFIGQGTAVAAVGFELGFDSAVLSIAATAGSAATNAGKTLATNVLPNGRTIFLIYGLNANSIGDGSLVDLKILVSPNASEQPYNLAFFNPSAASPAADDVAIGTHDGQIVVTTGPPVAFVKFAPPNNATGVTVNPTLSWSASSGTTGYEYCVDTSANSTCDTAWVSSATATGATLSALAPGTTYSWQVRAANGSGPTQANNGTWWTFTTQALPNPLTDLVIDFGPSDGLWSYDDGGGPSRIWQRLHNLSPSLLTRGDLDGNGLEDVVVDFAGLGVWAYMNNATWTPLDERHASAIKIGDLDGNGRDDVVIDFPGQGIWVRYDSGTYKQLHPMDVVALAVGNIDGSAGGKADVIVSFAGQGTWAYRDNAAWSLVHPLAAQDLQLGDLDGNGVADLIVQFAGAGEWTWYNSTRWEQLHPFAAAGIVTGNIDGDPGGKSDVVVNFPGFGVWAFVNNASWVQLHGLNAAAMTTGDLDGNGQADVLLGFPGYGLWALQNLTNWTQIDRFTPEAIVSAHMNGN